MKRCNVLAATLLGVLTVAAPVDAQEKEPAYANPQLLVTTNWLGKHAGDEGLRILDVRSGKAYAKAHIPGAIHLECSDTFAKKGPNGMIGSVDRLAALFGSRGIDRSVHVVVYDEGRSTSASRMLWTLEVLGHPRVSVLNGGIVKWTEEKRATTDKVTDPAPAEFEVEPAEVRSSTKEEMCDGLGNDDVVMLDVRSKKEFTGERAYSKRGGHVPGAVHIEWTANFTKAEAPVFLPPKELRYLYESKGITPDKRVHAY